MAGVGLSTERPVWGLGEETRPTGRFRRLCRLSRAIPLAAWLQRLARPEKVQAGMAIPFQPLGSERVITDVQTGLFCVSTRIEKDRCTLLLRSDAKESRWFERDYNPVSSQSRSD